MDEPGIAIERVQTGVRLEKRILKVLKAVAGLRDMTLGDLLEGIVLHAFEGKPPFEAATLQQIAQLRRIYDLDLDAGASHRLRESAERTGEPPAKAARARRRRAPRGAR